MIPEIAWDNDRKKSIIVVLRHAIKFIKSNKYISLTDYQIFYTDAAGYTQYFCCVPDP